jgi:hypothetical protein
MGLTSKIPHLLHELNIPHLNPLARSESPPPPQYITYFDPETSDTFQFIYVISSSMDTPNLLLSSKKILSEALYTAEHRLLSLEQNSFSSSKPRNQISSLAHAFAVAALLYLQIVIREIPVTSKVHHRLVSKLHVFREEYNVEWVDYNGSAYENVLLWVMFVGTMASLGDERWDGFCLGTTKEDVREKLRSIAWRDRKCDPILDQIWSRQRWQWPRSDTSGARSLSCES